MTTIAFETMTNSSKFTILSCTSDRCHNSTQKHQALTPEEIISQSLKGEGWYVCTCCGTVRQSIRNSGRYQAPRDFSKP